MIWKILDSLLKSQRHVEVSDLVLVANMFYAGRLSALFLGGFIVCFLFMLAMLIYTPSFSTSDYSSSKSIVLSFTLCYSSQAGRINILAYLIYSLSFQTRS